MAILDYRRLILITISFFVLHPNEANFVPGERIERINYNLVHSWADKLGMELFHLGDFITRRKEVQESFKEANVVSRSGAKIVDNLANEISLMMELKISAVRRIMDAAENTALIYQNEKAEKNFSYYNAKEMIEPHEPIPTEPPRELDDAGVEKIFITPKEIILTPKIEFFDQPVNMSVSAVHVPTNVYDRASEVIKGIKWSENLDQIFRDNHKNDPTLSWQFFGSATGFMRQFPAVKWKAEPVDLYDCRLRSWFMEAANSPKDVIILMDASGSMTGQRQDVANHVVNTILDTLGTNDFVNVFTFGETVTPVVGCFRDSLVQANLGNIRELKEGIETVEPTSMANFTAALTKAFEVLEEYKMTSRGALCNQAIMIISDGAPFSYEEIFEQYNWRDPPYKPVRVFTYLIGKEVADVKDIKWMACANQGYYVHLSDMAEVREMVLNYIPVMARPLVLGRHDHPVIWTQVYADMVDIKISDWQWEMKQNHDQREDIWEYRRVGKSMTNQNEVRRRMYNRQKETWNQPDVDSDIFQFMTTVAMPVYDRRENANITEEVLINEALWELQTRETRIANLLGVAGTDVPIRDIKRLLSPFLLGVNGYAFIVTNNGYVLFHPDFRPIFQGNILKPAYNSVDMIEVELLDDNKPPREFNSVLITIRDSIINQSTGSKWMLVKNHFDKMKRVARIKRQYYWTAIQKTPFTLVITYPEQYGVYHLQMPTPDEIHRRVLKGNILSHFSGKRWKIHPKWLYCKHNNMTFDTPEEELLWFLGKMSKPGWKWPLSRSALPPEHTAAMFCNRDLMQALVFDARVTEWFSKNTSFNSKDDKRNEFKQRFGITVSFLATHSGLTRWHEFHSNMAEEAGAAEVFSETNVHAIDETWYKRAVDEHFVREESFIYSVPFDAGEIGVDTVVTASHAIFHTEGGKSAPAAVVGFQFQHSALYTLFRNITGNACIIDERDCYILDNNGFIIISPRRYETGKFFGEINGVVMQRLVKENVYQRVIVYDYQAVCFESSGDNNASDNLYSPLTHLLTILKWLVNVILWYMMQWSAVMADYIEHYQDENMTDSGKSDWIKDVRLLRTRLKSCDMQRALYTFSNDKENVVFNMTARDCERPYVVMPIPASNMILLVIDQSCPPQPPMHLTVNPVEINYNFDENMTLACLKHEHEFNRIRPISCINRHANESAIELCGDASSVYANVLLLLLGILASRYL